MAPHNSTLNGLIPINKYAMLRCILALQTIPLISFSDGSGLEGTAYNNLVHGVSFTNANGVASHPDINSSRVKSSDGTNSVHKLRVAR